MEDSDWSSLSHVYTAKQITLPRRMGCYYEKRDPGKEGTVGAVVRKGADVYIFFSFSMLLG
jgi:hypothetical protein